MESTHLLDDTVDLDSRGRVRRRALRKITIEPVLLLYLLYFSGSSTLFRLFVHGRLKSEDSRTHISTDNVVKNVQSEAAMWLMYMNIAYTIYHD